MHEPLIEFASCYVQHYKNTGLVGEHSTLFTQYDMRLFIDLQENASSEHVLYVQKIFFTFKTIFVHALTLYFSCEVHIFWKGHKILQNLHHRFDCYLGLAISEDEK